ncbi:MAG: bifunctional aspartate kinase/homoserine dehydrogenase I [Salinivirgaceae bacterium]
MIVLKFGGTSIADAKRIRQVSSIIDQYSDKRKLTIVVSALSGITNMLEESGKQALQNDKKYLETIKEVEDRHFEIINQLVDPKNRSEIAAHIQLLCNEAEEICQGISILNEYNDRSKAKLLSLGERMSSGVISSALNHLGHRNQLLDSRNLITTDSTYLSGKVNHKLSLEQTLAAYSNIEGMVVLSGFISKNEKGEATTLGRGGSDFTAALLGNYLNAERIDIWTDVNGMLTASPQFVSSAYTIPTLSYEEAMELSHFGAKVIYPPTIQPAMEKQIPIRIKNTFEPDHEGTLIGPNPITNGHNVKGFSSIDTISLVTISGSGMIGVQGIAMRAFKALSHAHVNVMFITQSSSEHTICVGVNSQEAPEACRSIDEEFENELARKKVNPVSFEDKLTIVAMVGDKMKESVGVAGRAFKLLGDNGINIRAIAQGGTERNISMVIAEKDTKKALNVLHDGFFLSKYRKIHLFNIGIGTVGGTMLEQLKEQAGFLKEEYAIDIRLAGVANSKKMLFNSKGISLESWKQDLLSHGKPMDLTVFIASMKELNLRNSIFIDNTASDVVAKIYQNIAELNIPVVASNKIMASSPLSQMGDFKKEIKKRGLKFLHETNVAAGLPILKTIEDLVASGDKILKIQAVLSGSLNYIFNNISSTVSFSEAVIQARQKGLTEPDPSIDLSGLDVRRKILILARASAYPLELEQVSKKDIIPEKELQSTSFDELLKNLEKNNALIEKIRIQAAAENKKLRYVAEFSDGVAQTGLQAVDASHPAYHLDGMDNIILLYTRRYHEQPLVIKGAGAGPGVTASGVFADVMRLANL